MKAKLASRKLQLVPADIKNKVLAAMADALQKAR